MGWTTVGSFLGRDVRFQRVEPAQGIDAQDISSSVVMLVIGVEFASFEAVEILSSRILSLAPLAMVLTGPGGRVGFDVTLELQSRRPELPHTMTKLSVATDPVEAIEDFLQATWPAEERLDEWKTYSVLVFGDSTVETEIREAIGIALS